MATSCHGKRIFGEKQPDDLLLDEAPSVDPGAASEETDHEEYFESLDSDNLELLSWIDAIDPNPVHVEDVLGFLTQDSPYGDGSKQESLLIAQTFASQIKKEHLPLANCKDPFKLASHLQRTFTIFSNLDEHSIIQFLQTGAKAGLQPKISPCDNQDVEFPTETTKRKGKKRGPYKMATKDSWTSTTESGDSCTAVPNASHNKRRPPTPFEQRFLFVKEIDINEASLGIAEVS